MTLAGSDLGAELLTAQADPASGAPGQQNGASAAEAIGRAIEMMLSAVTGTPSPGEGPLAEAATASSAQSTTSAGARQSTSGTDAGYSELQLLTWLTGTSGQTVNTPPNGDSSSASGTSAADGSQTGAAGGPPAGTPLPDASQSAGAALAHLAAAPHAAAAPQATATLQAPVGTSAWVEELGAQLTLMAHRGIDSASLHVSPAELGPIEVRISMQGRDASVWFGAAQAGTRHALQQALPQLRHLFSSQGLALADAGVFREPPRQSTGQSSAPAIRSITAPETPALEEIRARVQLGLLDLYA